jgi:hypothetical protein
MQIKSAIVQPLRAHKHPRGESSSDKKTSKLSVLSPSRPKPSGRSRAVNFDPKHKLFGVYHQLLAIHKKVDDRKLGKIPLVSGWLTLKSASRDEKSEESDPDPALAMTVSLAQNLLSSNHVETFILRSAASISSSNVPTLLSYINWDPSGLSEWTSISALFSEARLVQCRISMTGTVNSSVGAQAAMLLIGSQPALNTSTPTGTSSVMNTPDCTLLSMFTYTFTHAFRHSSPMRPNKLWAPIAAPASQVDAGTYGQFSLVCPVAGSLTASIQYLEVLIEYEVEVRART